MSLLDELKRHAEELLAKASAPADGEAAPLPSSGSLIDGVFGMIKSQGLGTLVDRFKQSGMGGVIGSWVGTGENLPISAEQIRNVLGGGSLEALAAKLGIPIEQAEAVLAQVLPGVVDKLTPQGVVEEPVAEETPAE